MAKIDIVLHFTNYIAHPYWPERETVISILKNSGIARQKSDEKRRTALLTQLKKLDLTEEDFKELERLAGRQWYRVAPKDESSEIIIPRHQLAGALVQTVATAPKVLRDSFTADSFRSMCQISDLKTNKFVSDGVFDRYVKLKESNMRSHQTNDFIENFDAVGYIILHPSMKSAALKRLLETTIEVTGIGASRKMGYGRGTLLVFKEEQ